MSHKNDTNIGNIVYYKNGFKNTSYRGYNKKNAYLQYQWDFFENYVTRTVSPRMLGLAVRVTD